MRSGRKLADFGGSDGALDRGRWLDGALKLHFVGHEVDINRARITISFDPMGRKGREGSCCVSIK